MNIVKAFADYLEDSSVATFGVNLFLSRVPASSEVNSNGDPIPQAAWWLVAGGGSQVGTNIAKLRNHVIEVYYRDRDTEQVYDKLQALADSIDCDGCLTLAGFEVTEVSTNGPFADQDMDSEERTVGLLQVTITTFKGGC